MCDSFGKCLRQMWFRMTPRPGTRWSLLCQGRKTWRALQSELHLEPWVVFSAVCEIRKPGCGRRFLNTQHTIWILVPEVWIAFVRHAKKSPNFLRDACDVKMRRANKMRSTGRLYRSPSRHPHACGRSSDSLWNRGGRFPQPPVPSRNTGSGTRTRNGRQTFLAAPNNLFVSFGNTESRGENGGEKPTHAQTREPQHLALFVIRASDRKSSRSNYKRTNIRDKHRRRTPMGIRSAFSGRQSKEHWPVLEACFQPSENLILLIQNGPLTAHTPPPTQANTPTPPPHPPTPGLLLAHLMNLDFMTSRWHTNF